MLERKDLLKQSEDSQACISTHQLCARNKQVVLDCVGKITIQYKFSCGSNRKRMKKFCHINDKYSPRPVTDAWTAV